jgi:DNA-binding MarR family transcriptional regulator/GNAT superfamily N-acetyltransferase
MEPTTERIRALRAFSRSYTCAVRALDEGHLATPYTLTEARILVELAHRGGADAAVLCRELELDASYLSRMLARFEADGLVTRERSSTDARRRRVVLTTAGLAAVRTLESRSDDQARALLGRFDEADQIRLVDAMATVRSLLEPTVAAGPTVVLRAPDPGDLGWVVARHGALYAAEYGWDGTFEGLVARIVADFVADHDPARERAWIAEVDGDRAGCVFCVARTADTAALRILLVEPWARGRGVGAALVGECVRFARAAGYAELMLWTNDVLTSARRLYQAAGFELVDSEPHHSFGHDLVGQTWRLPLRPAA